MFLFHSLFAVLIIFCCVLPLLTLAPSDYPLIKVPQSRVHLFKMSMCVSCCCRAAAAAAAAADAAAAAAAAAATAAAVADNFIYFISCHQVVAAAFLALPSSHERPTL